MARHELAHVLEQPVMFVMHLDRSVDHDHRVIPRGHDLAVASLLLVPGGRHIRVRTMEYRHGRALPLEGAPVRVTAGDVTAQRPGCDDEREHRREKVAVGLRDERGRVLLRELGQQRERVVDDELAVARLVHRGRLSRQFIPENRQETRMLPRPPETSISTRFAALSKSGDAQPSMARGKRASSTLVDPIAIRERTRAATPCGTSSVSDATPASARTAVAPLPGRRTRVSLAPVWTSRRGMRNADRSMLERLAPVCRDRKS